MTNQFSLVDPEFWKLIDKLIFVSPNRDDNPLKTKKQHDRHDHTLSGPGKKWRVIFVKRATVRRLIQFWRHRILQFLTENKKKEKLKTFFSFSRTHLPFYSSAQFCWQVTRGHLIQYAGLVANSVGLDHPSGGGVTIHMEWNEMEWTTVEMFARWG